MTVVQVEAVLRGDSFQHAVLRPGHRVVVVQAGGRSVDGSIAYTVNGVIECLPLLVVLLILQVPAPQVIEVPILGVTVVPYSVGAATADLGQVHSRNALHVGSAVNEHFPPIMVL